jgi:2-iminoacetate synthase
MLHINAERIEKLLANSKHVEPSEIYAVLEKAKKLQRLTLEETATLLTVEDPALLQEIFKAAAYVKDMIYGRRVVLFAPLYISNLCANKCLYCAFQSGNTELKRKALTIEEIQNEVRVMLERGHKRILMVAGEAGANGKEPVDYYVDAINAIYSVSVGPHKIKRVNINCAPLTVPQFKKLKNAGIGTFQIFQETYHDKTYRQMHVDGPKTDPDNRIDAVDRAFEAGIDDIGIGALYGLYDYRFETLGLLSHVEHMEQKFKVGPHTISVPRIEPALGSDVSNHPPYALTDTEFKKVVAVLRLSVPYTGIIMSTRETAAMRDELVNLGVSQVSAESKTAPGGYGEADINAQFETSDTRTLDEVISSLIEQKYIPSFCAGCYRKERTGETFMNMARPGTIKGKCSMNALITLKEYCDDFASPEVKVQGYKLIENARKQMTGDDQEQLAVFFEHVTQGIRDEYV